MSVPSRIDWQAVSDGPDGQPNTWTAAVPGGFVVVHASPFGFPCMAFVPGGEAAAYMPGDDDLIAVIDARIQHALANLPTREAS